MKQIFTFLTALLIGVYSFAEKPRAAIDKATTAPVIDGVIDELWASVPANNIDRVYQSDSPTLGNAGTTYWKALFDDKGIYVLVNVNDNVHAPAYLNNSGADYLYDLVELYFDCNFLKEDGKGPSVGSGHYQFNMGFSATNSNGEFNKNNDGVEWSFKVNGGPYVLEYYIPFSKLRNSDGLQVDVTGEIGFDLYVIDSDSSEPERQRATWSNEGYIGESNGNMDDCGIITLTGADAGYSVESITITPDSLHLDNKITIDNDTLQLTTHILPVDAAVQAVLWKVINKTGKAQVSQQGLLTALSNGIVTVVATATDGTYVDGQIDITISGQVVETSEFNIFKGGSFDTDGPLSGPWYLDIYTGGGDAQVIDGVLSTTAATGLASRSDFKIQQTKFIVDAESNYILTFEAWAPGGDCEISYNFEDSNNGWTRFGHSYDGDSQLENSGTCQWNTTITNVRTRYEKHVIFDNQKPNPNNIFNFMFGKVTCDVMLDNLGLYTEEDYSRIVLGVPVTENNNRIKVYPNPVTNELNISLNASQSKISIYNSLGQKILEKITSDCTAKINVASLSKGVYIVKVNNEESIKFIK